MFGVKQRGRRMIWLLTSISLMSFASSSLAGGFIGIDHRVNADDRGFWKRRNQLVLVDGLVLAAAAGAAWEGKDSRLVMSAKGPSCCGCDWRCLDES